MARTAQVLLLIGSTPEHDWWRRPERVALCRAIFNCWWQGATTAVLLPARTTADGLPVPAERQFICGESAHIVLPLRCWLLARRGAQVVVAGPGAAAVASRLAPQGLLLEATDSMSTQPTDDLVLRIV